MNLQTPRLVLREHQPQDLEALLTYTRDPALYRYEGVLVPPEMETRAYLQRALDAQTEMPRRYYLFAITIRPHDRPVGRIKLKLNNLAGHEWEIGWGLQRECWGQGYASEAAREVLRFAFEELNAHRVIAFCNANNLASARVMQKIGMQQDGCLREALWWNESWADELVYSILEREFKK